MKECFFPPVWALVPQSFEVQGGIWHYAGIGRIRPLLQGLLQFPQDQCWKRQTLISNKFYISGERMCVAQVENKRRTNAPRLVNTLLWAWFPGPTQDLQGGMKLLYKGNEFQISMTNIGVEIRIQDQSEGIPRQREGQIPGWKGQGFTFYCKDWFNYCWLWKHCNLKVNAAICSRWWPWLPGDWCRRVG